MPAAALNRAGGPAIPGQASRAEHAVRQEGAAAGPGLRLTGLCDEAEHGCYTRGLERAGAPRQGFFVCAADPEDELIRALGTTRVREIIRAEGDDRALRTFLRQPAQQGRAPRRQLRRFPGTKKGRRIRYGRVLVEALGPGDVPDPLDGLLAGL